MSDKRCEDCRSSLKNPGFQLNIISLNQRDGAHRWILPSTWFHEQAYFGPDRNREHLRRLGNIFWHWEHLDEERSWLGVCCIFPSPEGVRFVAFSIESPLFNHGGSPKIYSRTASRWVASSSPSPQAEAKSNVYQYI